MEELTPGQLVRSKAGRDKGKHYLVLKVIDQTRVLLVDGGDRPIKRPKKKNMAHLQPYHKRADFCGWLALGKLTDGQIARSLYELAPRETSSQEEEV